MCVIVTLQGSTPAIWAALKGHTAALKVLIEAGANVNHLLDRYPIVRQVLAEVDAEQQARMEEVAETLEGVLGHNVWYDRNILKVIALYVKRGGAPPVQQPSPPQQQGTTNPNKRKQPDTE